MREFAHRIGAFTGWTEERRRALLGPCVQALNSIPAVAVGAAMSVADFEALHSEARSALGGTLGAPRSILLLFPRSCSWRGSRWCLRAR